MKPPERPVAESLFHIYHRTSKCFDGGWYDQGCYELTTYDWDGGQVMGARGWQGEMATQLGLDEYTAVHGPMGGRDWNGMQVDDKGYLTGNSFNGPSITVIGGNPLAIFRNVSRFLKVAPKLAYSISSRQKLLGKIQNTKVRNLFQSVYKKENIGKPLTGTGSAMDAYRWTAATGQKIGNSDHVIKMAETFNAATRIMKNQMLNDFDKRIVQEIINDVTKALKGN